MSVVNVESYSAELREAGLPGDCASDGRVDFADGTSWRPGTVPSNEQERTAAAVYAAHNPAPSRADLLRAAGLTEREAALALVADPSEPAPSWARDLIGELAAQARAALALVLLAVLVTLVGCAGPRGGGSIESTARWFAPSSAQFEERHEPNTPTNPTPVTVTVIVPGGGGGELVGGIVNTFAPGWGTLAAGALGAGGLLLAGKRVSSAQLLPALRLLMQGLESAPPEVRGWVRDRARATRLSPFFESMIASGQVPPLPPIPPAPPSSGGAA